MGDTLDLFNTEDVLEIILESDFKAFLKNKYKDEYQPAVIRYMYNDTIKVSRNIKIKPRGAFRRANCYYPPMKLNFPKGKVRLKQLEEFDKMKMVSECKRNQLHEQYVFNEYLVYKLYNILTDYSFRVKLLKVTYYDLGKDKETYGRYAFLIESSGQLAARLNALEIKTKNIGDAYIDRDLGTVMYVFQFLIGNTDWSVPGLHNVKLLKSKDPTAQLMHAVPYDFDYSGIVNAQYAIPHESLGISSVRERLYRGFCREKSELDETLDMFRAKKSEIVSLFEDFELLEDRYRKSTLKYIDEFYRIINSESWLKREILESCRK
jgi:hypothetical protein